MINTIIEQVYQYRKYRGKHPGSIGVTKEQFDLIVDELRGMGSYTHGVNETPQDAPKENLIMGIPIRVVDLIINDRDA
jgi:hypothetical protein